MIPTILLCLKTNFRSFRESVAMRAVLCAFAVGLVASPPLAAVETARVEMVGSFARLWLACFNEKEPFTGFLRLSCPLESHGSGPTIVTFNCGICLVKRASAECAGMFAFAGPAIGLDRAAKAAGGVSGSGR